MGGFSSSSWHYLTEYTTVVIIICRGSEVEASLITELSESQSYQDWNCLRLTQLGKGRARESFACAGNQRGNRILHQGKRLSVGHLSFSTSDTPAGSCSQQRINAVLLPAENKCCTERVQLRRQIYWNTHTHTHTLSNLFITSFHMVSNFHSLTRQNIH